MMWGFSCDPEEGKEEAEEVGEGRGGRRERGDGGGRDGCKLRRRKTVWGRVDSVNIRKRIAGM
jgi:hypothetical protein